MKYSFAALFLLLFLPQFSFGQSGHVPDIFKNMSMRSIGPSVMSGRVTAIDVSERDENVIYVGTASGGLWKSESGGAEWRPVFDEQEIIGIGAVYIDPNAEDVIWAGTGEGNPRNSQTGGAGIYRSPDGGRSWKKMGLESTHTIHRIIVNPTNPQVVFVGAHGNAWAPDAERGVFKTSNGGTTWEKILFVNDTTGCADLVMDPGNPDKLFAAMYQYQRKPYMFTSGGIGSGLHMTLDGGKSWTRLTDKNGLPEGEFGRIGICISKTNSKCIYALIECKKTGLYKSEDGGFKWKLVNDKDVGDRPFYYHELYVDPSNENHLIYLHSIVSESIDGGKTWKTLLPYYGVHPDHHAFWWSEKNPQFMLEGNDGGLNLSRDGGRSWVFINNLPLGQFYHINYDMEIPYNVYGGMQDNGSWKGPGYVWHHGGIQSSDWQEILFGDGFDVVPKQNDSRYAYAMSQGGEVYYIDTKTGSSRCVKPVHPDGKKLRFHWNSGIAHDPHASCGIYFGSQFLHYSNDCGQNWKIISPDLTTNDSTKQRQFETGGLTPDQTSAENHCTILCIAPSAIDKNVVWAGTDDGNVQLTQNGGSTWSNCAMQIKNMPRGSWVAQIVAGTHTAGEAFVVVNNYRQGDSRPYLFHTKDFGQTWENLVNENSVHGHCLSVVQDPVESSLIFLGTEHGLYVTFDGGKEWLKWTHNYPNVATQDLKIHPRENDLIIGTFGRAAYVLDDITPLRVYAGSNKKSFDKKLVALNVPDAYQCAYMQQRGERFPADHHFSGQNKNYGARLGYYFEIKEGSDKKESASKAKTDKKADTAESKSTENKLLNQEKDKNEKDKKVKIILMNLTGDTLRAFTHEPDTGFNYVHWYFDTRGVRYPSRQDEKKDADEPGGGPSVAPGEYKVVYVYKDLKDSAFFTVKQDPRLDWNADAHAKYMERTKKLQGKIETASRAVEQLREAKKTIELVGSALANVPDSTKKQVLAQGDSLKKKIETLMNYFFLPEDTKGIVDDSEKLNSKIWSANAYLDENNTGSNATYATEYVEKEITKVVNLINDFFEKDWKTWRESVEKIQFSLFKEIKRL